MGRPGGHIRISQSTRHEIERSVPFPVSMLGDRDEHFWRQFTCVALKRDRRLYVFEGGAVLWATIRDDMVVRVELLEGQRARREFDAHAYSLPKDYADRILSSLRESRDASEGLREVFGDRLIPLEDLAESSQGDHPIYWFLVRYHWPALRAVLKLEVDAQHRIVRADLQQGARAARTIESLRKSHSP